jgi:hypothetical protein
MQHRYGLDQRAVGRIWGVALLLIAFVGILVYVAFGVTRNPVEFRLVSYEAAGPDRIDATLSVEKPSDSVVYCTLRAQDRTHTDVGYATVVIPAEQSDVLVDYSMRTLAPAYGMELLGCSVDQPPGVTPPQFPPGVVPPPQPY